jgi:putative redox protein
VTVADAGTTLVSGDVRLWAHLARSPQSSARKSALGVVICHGLPAGAGSAPSAGHTFVELAERVANDTGWSCLVFGFRGTGASQGQFSIGGWLADLRAAVAFMRAEHIEGVWLAGFSTGGTIAVHLAAQDPTIRGVATLAAPSDLTAWSNDPSYLVALAREVGALDARATPDLKEWAREISDLDPLGSAAMIPPRPFLIVHGSDDDTVPVADSRALADAAPGCEVHVIPMAGHRLRHDPRSIALLLGWLDRQTG